MTTEKENEDFISSVFGFARSGILAIADVGNARGVNIEETQAAAAGKVRKWKHA